jgi:hypothetical protein
MLKKILISVVGLLMLSLTNSAYAQSSDDKRMAKLVLESFCQDFYSSCFSGRTYVENSLSVTRVEQASLNQIKVYGFHSYKGRLGTSYPDMEYIAYITMSSNRLKIKFRKRSKADFVHPEDYWEECEKTIHTDD